MLPTMQTLLIQSSLIVVFLVFFYTVTIKILKRRKSGSKEVHTPITAYELEKFSKGLEALNEAKVFGKAKVYNDAKVYNIAKVYYDAKVSGDIYDESGRRSVHIDETVELVNQIDEPQKVLVPKFVAELIEKEKEKKK